MRPLLFYFNDSEYQKDPSHQLFLNDLFGVEVEVYPVEDHRNEYDHKTLSKEELMDCWCNIPKYETWPQLYFNSERNDRPQFMRPKFVAAGNDIIKLTLEDIRKKYGNNTISGPGPWEE